MYRFGPELVYNPAPVESELWGHFGFESSKYRAAPDPQHFLFLTEGGGKEILLISSQQYLHTGCPSYSEGWAGYHIDWISGKGRILFFIFRFRILSRILDILPDTRYLAGY